MEQKSRTRMTMQFTPFQRMRRVEFLRTVGEHLLPRCLHLFCAVLTAGLLFNGTAADAQSQRGWSLEVLIQDKRNDPVADAAVELVFNDASRVLTEARTDRRGRATLNIPTRQPVDLAGLNLFLYVEADRLAPELKPLTGKPDRMFTLRLDDTVDNQWARRTGQRLLETGSQLIDILLPAAGSAGMPVAPLISGDPCDALPSGMNQCIRCPGLDMPTAVINGRVAFGRHKGKTRDELQRACGNAPL